MTTYQYLRGSLAFTYFLLGIGPNDREPPFSVTIRVLIPGPELRKLLI